MTRRNSFGVAVALFLVSLLLGSIFMPLKTQVENRKIEQTEALLGKASHNTIDVGEHGMAWAYEGRNSIQGLDNFFWICYKQQVSIRLRYPNSVSEFF